MPYFHQLKVGYAHADAGRVSALTAPTGTINCAYSDTTGAAGGETNKVTPTDV
jgi:hypothetical protein